MLSEFSYINLFVFFFFKNIKNFDFEGGRTFFFTISCVRKFTLFTHLGQLESMSHYFCMCFIISEDERAWIATLETYFVKYVLVYV